MIVILLAKDILLAKERHLTQSCTSEEGLLTQLSDTSFTLGSDSHALALGPRAGHQVATGPGGRLQAAVQIPLLLLRRQQLGDVSIQGAAPGVGAAQNVLCLPGLLQHASKPLTGPCDAACGALGSPAQQLSLPAGRYGPHGQPRHQSRKISEIRTANDAIAAGPRGMLGKQGQEVQQGLGGGRHLRHWKSSLALAAGDTPGL